MDGWITIGTKLDNKKFDRQITDLENKIKNEEQKQELNIQARTGLEQEQAKILSQVEEITKEYEKAVDKAEKLKAVVGLTKPRNSSKLYGNSGL